MSDEAGLLVRVDPSFKHRGPAWIDGHPPTDGADTEVGLWESPDRFTFLQLSASDDFQWLTTSFRMIDEAPGIEASASHVNCVSIVDSNGDPFPQLPPLTWGRVRLSTLDWTTGDPVHFEFGLHVREAELLSDTHDGDRYFLRGSGTLNP